MTTIITLWMAAIVAVTILCINQPFEYIPSVGAHKPSQANIPLLLIFHLCFFILIVVTTTSIYLRHRIIKSKNFFHSVKRNAAQERKSNKAGRLAEILQEQVKPTMAVFRVGGIDAVLDMISAVIITVAALVFPANINIVTFIVTGPLIVYSTQHPKSANHCLLYNFDIQEKMIGCIRPRTAK